MTIMKTYTKPELKVTECKTESVLLKSGTGAQGFDSTNTVSFSDISF